MDAGRVTASLPGISWAVTPSGLGSLFKIVAGMVTTDPASATVAGLSLAPGKFEPMNTFLSATILELPIKEN
jgi:hypothetical protein